MRTVGIKLLRNNLSEYVRAAASGETVVATDRDRVVAHLIPPPPVSAMSDEEFIAMGVRDGRIRPARRRGPPPRPEGQPKIPLETLLEDLSKDRENR